MLTRTAWRTGKRGRGRGSAACRGEASSALICAVRGESDI